MFFKASLSNVKEKTMERLMRLSVLGLAFVLTMMFIQTAVNLRLDYFSRGVVVTNSDVITIEQRQRQLDCLAINIYREAGYEPFEGKVAVAQVTLNRASNKNFPQDICQVVYQKSVIMEKVVCQFSWYCDRAVMARPVNKESYNESYEVAKKVLLEGFKLKVLDDALFYHADYVNPKWNKEKIGKIGRHIFYR